MKTIRNLAISFLVLSICLVNSKTSVSQFLGFQVIADSVLYGNYYDPFLGDSIDLTGFIVYEVYACMEFPENCVVAVFGGASDLDTLCMNPDDTDNLLITFTGDVFNNEAGSILGSSLNCGFCTFAPTLCFDSFVTIGSDCSSDGGSGFTIQLPCEQEEWADTFSGTIPGEYIEPGNDLYIDNGAWFTLAGGFDSNNSAGDDLKVLVAQITTNGDFDMSACVSYQANCIAGEEVLYDCVDESFVNPCVNNMIDTQPTINPALCFGDDNVVTFDDGGNGPVDYTIYDATTDLVLSEIYDADPGLVINTLDPGSYYATLIDSIGCRDTTIVFTLTEPPLLTFDASITQDILCFGDAIGAIATTCTGGTGTVNVDYSGPMSGTVPCGSAINNLITGTYLLTATDSNSCEQSLSFTLANPAQLEIDIAVTNLDCQGDGDGLLSGSITGGTGVISADWSGDAVANFSGPSVLDVSLSNLDGGNYTLNATDENGCPVSESFVVNEPSSLTAEITTVNATCYGFCDGEINVNAEGGTGPLDVEITGGSFADLCTGEYVITITDEESCTLAETVTIDGFSEINYEFSFNDISCFGACDGAIEVQNINGGCGSFQFAISPAAGTTNETGNSVSFENLCPGNYDVEITDDCGCGVTISDISITEPAELSVETAATMIDCFGNNNGTIAVTSPNEGTITMTQPEMQMLPFTLENLAPGTYHIVIQDEAGCMDSTDVIITEPAELLASVTSTTAVGCGGDCDATISIEYSGGTSPYSFEMAVSANPEVVWMSGPLDSSGSDIVEDVCAENWLLNVVDAMQCVADTLAVLIEEPDPIVINLTEDWITCTGMCDGSAIVLFSGGTGELSAQFFPDELDPICAIGSCALVDMCEGVYSVTVTDEASCEEDTTIVIGAELVSDMILTMFSSPETCWNEMDGTATVGVTLNNGTPPLTYQWNDVLNQTTATAVGLASNEIYTVVVTDAIGCTLTGQVMVETSPGCFLISTALTPNGDGVNDEWLIGGLEYFPEATVQVYNRWAQLLFESRGYDAPWDGKFKGRELPVADYYFVINYSVEAEPIKGTVTIKY